MLLNGRGCFMCEPSVDVTSEGRLDGSWEWGHLCGLFVNQPCSVGCPVSKPRGSHLLLPVEAFVTGIKTYDWQKVCWLIILFWSFWSLNFQWVKGKILVVRSWSIDFCSLEVTLIPRSDVKKGLIQFWFHSQTLLHEIHKWLLFASNRKLNWVLKGGLFDV